MPLLAACSSTSEPQVPAQPSFEADVKPIMVLRCVRCHGAGGTLQGDPPGSPLPGPPPNGYFDHYEDRDCTITDAGTISETCKRGAAYYVDVIRQYINMTGEFRMPPPPAPMLTSRELDILNRWAAETPPRP
jgi:mono/diheme cytochrome c family protein